MVGMVTDMTLATENQNNFQEYLSNNPNPGIDLTVAALTSRFWQSHKSNYLSLLVEMVKCVQVFKEFYETKAKHRKFTWTYSLGTCNVNGKFDSKTIELILGTYSGKTLKRSKMKNNLGKIFPFLIPLQIECDMSCYEPWLQSPIDH